MDAFHADMLALAVTPGILISACGVVTTAVYNRLGVVLSKIRLYNQRKMDFLLGHLPHQAFEPQLLLDLIDAQIVAVTAKAKMLQKGLYCLLAAIVALLLCSVCAGFATVYQWFGLIALSAGFAAVCLFVAGLGWALGEVTRALTPVEAETAYLNALMSQHLVRSHEKARLKIAS